MKTNNSSHGRPATSNSNPAIKTALSTTSIAQATGMVSSVGESEQSEHEPAEETIPVAGAAPLLQQIADPEVSAKVARRRFSADYKLRILRQVDECKSPGQIGALLRREGLYSSHIKSWQKQREAGSMSALREKKRGRKQKEVNPLAKEVARLQKENTRLEKKLQQAEIIIDVQKKVSQLLGIVLPETEEK